MVDEVGGDAALVDDGADVGGGHVEIGRPRAVVVGVDAAELPGDAGEHPRGPGVRVDAELGGRVALPLRQLSVEAGGDALVQLARGRVGEKGVDSPLDLPPGREVALVGGVVPVRLLVVRDVVVEADAVAVEHGADSRRDALAHGGDAAHDQAAERAEEDKRHHEGNDAAGALPAPSPCPSARLVSGALPLGAERAAAPGRGLLVDGGRVVGAASLRGRAVVVARLVRRAALLAVGLVVLGLEGVLVWVRLVVGPRLVAGHDGVAGVEGVDLAVVRAREPEPRHLTPSLRPFVLLSILRGRPTGMLGERKPF